MLLLVTDTSGKHGSVALARAKSGHTELIESVPLAGGTFSARLVPQIAELLAKRGFSKHEIDAFVVISGPGSFTGLRIGLAAIKALAEILEKPIVPVSLLEVIAVAAAKEGKIISALDAGRGEVYAGEYEIAETAHRNREQLLTREEFLSMAGGFVVATPDQTLAEAARHAGIRVINVPLQNLEIIARMGRQKLHAGKSVSPDQLEANYIRRSDAEIFAKSDS